MSRKEEEIKDILLERALCPYCGLPNYEHDGSGFCPPGTEEFGGRR